LLTSKNYYSKLQVAFGMSIEEMVADIYIWKR